MLYTVSAVPAVLLQELVLHPVPEPLDTERLPSALSPFSWRLTAAARA